jgi:hypothetical protein
MSVKHNVTVPSRSDRKALDSHLNLLFGLIVLGPEGQTRRHKETAQKGGGYLV